MTSIMENIYHFLSGNSLKAPIISAMGQVPCLLQAFHLLPVPLLFLL